MHKLKLHKVFIQSLSFSHNELYLASLGGIDDKNSMIIWDVENGKVYLLYKNYYYRHCMEAPLVLQMLLSK